MDSSTIVAIIVFVSLTTLVGYLFSIIEGIHNPILELLGIIAFFFIIGYIFKKLGA